MMLGVVDRNKNLPGGALERRRGDRFPIERELSYKTINARAGCEPGCGMTVNLSSSGILFAANEPLPPGRRLELSVSWPVQLEGKCGLNLVTRGRVVRSFGNLVAVEIEKYEFRTQRTAGITPLLALAKSAVLVP